jgi:hypothetical protein
MRIRSLVAIAALVLPLSLTAQTVYNYTGTDFTQEFIATPTSMGPQPVNPSGSFDPTGPYAAGDHLSGELTFSTALAPNLTNAYVVPESFSFSDGVQTITDANAKSGSPFFVVSTNASGDIISYMLNATSNVDPNDFFIAQTIPPGSSPADDAKFSYDGNVYSVITNTNGSFAPGVAATPEPSSLALLGSGVLGVAFELRRRLRRA